MTTPRQVRALLKKKNIPLDIQKFSNCWFVINKKDSPVYYSFDSSSLNTYRLDDFSTEQIVEDIEDMIKNGTVISVEEINKQSN